MLDEVFKFPSMSRRSLGLLVAIPILLIMYAFDDALRFPTISRRSLGLLLAILMAFIA